MDTQVKEATGSATEKPDAQQIILNVEAAGNTGANVTRWALPTFKPAEHPHLRMYASNLDSAQLDRWFDEKAGDATYQAALADWRAAAGRFDIRHLGEGTRFGAGGNRDLGRRHAERHRDWFMSHIEPAHANLFIGSGGGGCGSATLPYLASLVDEVNTGLDDIDKKIAMAAIVMPFGDDGGSMRRRARETRAELTKLIPTLTFYNHEVPADFEDLPMSQLHTKINEITLHPFFNTFREIILEVGENNIDLQDTRNTLNLGKFLTYGHAPIPKGASHKQVIDTVLKVRMQMSCIETAVACLIWFRGGPSLVRRDIRLISEGICEKMREESSDFDRDVHRGVFEKAEDDNNSVSFLAVSPEEPSRVPAGSRVVVPANVQATAPAAAEPVAVPQAPAEPVQAEEPPVGSVAAHANTPVRRFSLVPFMKDAPWRDRAPAPYPDPQRKRRTRSLSEFIENGNGVRRDFAVEPDVLKAWEDLRHSLVSSEDDYFDLIPHVKNGEIVPAIPQHVKARTPRIRAEIQKRLTDESQSTAPAGAGHQPAFAS